MAPPELAMMTRAYGGITIFPLFLQFLRMGSYVFGVSIEAFRLPLILTGLSALLLLAIFIKVARLPMASLGALVLIGTSQRFFNEIHSVRPEAIVLFILALNVCLWMATTDRFSAWFCGTAAGLAIGVHTIAVIFLPVLGLTYFFLKQDQERPQRVLWWIIGVLSGVCWVMPQLDIATMMESSIFYFGKNIQSPSLWRWKGNFVLMLLNELKFLGCRNQINNPFHVPMMAVLLSVLSWQIRRFKALAVGRRILCVMSLGTVVAHMLFSASPNGRYLLYGSVWLWMQGAVVVSDLFRGRISLQTVDVCLFPVWLFVMYVSTYSILGSWIIIGFLIYLVLTKARHYAASKIFVRVLALSTGLLGMLMLHYPEFFFQAVYSLRYFVRHRPFMFMVCILWPWLLFRFENGRIVLSTASFRLSQEQSVATVFVVLMMLFQMKDWLLLGGRFQELADRRSQTEKMIAAVAGTRLLLAPGVVWLSLTQPQSFQALSPIPIAKPLMHPTWLKKQLRKCNPSIILWPVDPGSLFPMTANYRYGKKWMSQHGELQEIIHHETKVL